MAEKVELEIVTPARSVYDGKADEVVLPGVEGQLGVLPGHLPLLTALDIGELIIRNDGKERRFGIEGGFAEVDRARVTVLTEECYGVDEIDIEHARQMLQDAERELDALEKLSNDGDVEENLVEHHRKMLKRARMRMVLSDKE